MKKAIALILSVIIMSTVFSASPIEAASKSSYSVKVGKKVTIDTGLENAIWGSDDITVATVTQKGIVKGVSAGTCTIVATSNGESELFTVKVTKSKKSNTVEILSGTIGDRYYGTPVFKQAPVAYIAGNKVTFFETTYSELVKGLKGSGYSVSCEHGVNDIVANSFQVDVMKGKVRYACLDFTVTDSMLAKDAVVFSAQIETSRLDFYYFNSAFKLKSIPLFEDFKESNLFSEKLRWDYYEVNRDGITEIGCQCGINYVDDYYYTLTFRFDSSSHKCISVYMKGYK